MKDGIAIAKEVYRHPESITTHRLADGTRQKGTRDRPANRIFPGSHDLPLASAGRAAALRSVVPRQLVEEWRDACERDIDGSKAKPRNILGW